MFTVDTRENHCPIRIAYCGANPAAGPLHASELTDRIYLPRDYPIAVIKATEYSDYSGSSVERSNHRVLADIPGIVQIIGSHGYQALAYDATLGPVPVSEELCDILEGLEVYPLVDEDDESALENDMESEAWESDGRQDFRKALVGVLDALDDDDGFEAGFEHELPDDDTAMTTDHGIDSVAPTFGAYLWDLWRSGCDELNVNGGSGFVIETGSMVYFYIDEWCRKAGTDARYPTDKPIHLVLRHLAEKCRIAE